MQASVGKQDAFNTYAHCTMVGKVCGHSSKTSGAMPISYTNPICLAPKQLMRTPGVPSSGGRGIKFVTPPSKCMLPRKLLVSRPSIQRGIWQDVISALIRSSRSEKSLTSWPVGVPKLPNMPSLLPEEFSTELTATNVLPIHLTCASSGRADWRKSSRRMPSLPRVPCLRQSSIRSSHRFDTVSIERPLLTHAAIRDPADAPGERSNERAVRVSTWARGRVGEHESAPASAVDRVQHQPASFVFADRYPASSRPRHTPT